MTPQDEKRISKFLSLVLRHRPDLARVTPDAAGWVPIDDLLAGVEVAGQTLNADQLSVVVRNSDKQRFTISPDGTYIRAAQGHSFPVDLGLAARTPPDVLFHGTARPSVTSILGRGLVPGKRQQVHLSLDVQTALTVGQRHGDPVVFQVDTAGMTSAGLAFYRADNGVWLTDHVPAKFLELIDDVPPSQRAPL